MDLTVRQRLEADLKSAMRAGDAISRDAIRYILSAVKNAEIDHRGSDAPFDEVAPLRKLGKQLSDAATQFRDANRIDLALHEEAQLAVLQRYLPAELDDDALAALARDAVRQSGATTPKEMGKVMPLLIERVAGRADGHRISAAAKNALAALAT